ncbi:hypothetical protein C8Q80DRAFT_230388 [Daedaleopsis nitida]|nr:hypothetical protein C8Q80DRAFT_230388 [Daedaleopsis nitida]
MLKELSGRLLVSSERAMCFAFVFRGLWDIIVSSFVLFNVALSWTLDTVSHAITSFFSAEVFGIDLKLKSELVRERPPRHTPERYFIATRKVKFTINLNLKYVLLEPACNHRNVCRHCIQAVLDQAISLVLTAISSMAAAVTATIA